MLKKWLRPQYDFDDEHGVLEHLSATIAWDKAHPVRYRLWRICVRLRHPVKTLRQAVRTPYHVLQDFWQRGRRGWAVNDTWSIDGYLDDILPPMLDWMREHSHGYPAEFEPLGMDKAEAAWSGDGGILDQMAEGFRAHKVFLGADYMVTDPATGKMVHDKEKEAELTEKFEAGMKLFVKYYSDLWD